MKTAMSTHRPHRMSKWPFTLIYNNKDFFSLCVSLSVPFVLKIPLYAELQHLASRYLFVAPRILTFIFKFGFENIILYVIFIFYFRFLQLFYDVNKRNLVQQYQFNIIPFTLYVF